MDRVSAAREVLVSVISQFLRLCSSVRHSIATLPRRDPNIHTLILDLITVLYQWTLAACYCALLYISLIFFSVVFSVVHCGFSLCTDRFYFTMWLFDYLYPCFGSAVGDSAVWRFSLCLTSFGDQNVPEQSSARMARGLVLDLETQGSDASWIWWVSTLRYFYGVSSIFLLSL